MTTFDPERHKLVAVHPDTGEHVHVPFPQVASGIDDALVGALKAMAAKMQALEARNAELEARVASVEAPLQALAAEAKRRMEAA